MKTVNVTTEDGFSGTLQLDIGSIKSEVKGYKNSTHTVAETVNVREKTDVKPKESVGK